uniref:SAM domain-containing protein n=1 Tax=Meleagris gallopavo TaxID=9103 RepID=A0A803YGD6_MELGA
EEEKPGACFLSFCFHMASSSPLPNSLSVGEDRTQGRSVNSSLFSFSSEIEAKEACDWLRAAGFPQYAQLYENSQFPIDIAAVKKDHDFLDKDLVEPLCRRLNTLNKCASMKLDVNFQRKKVRQLHEMYWLFLGFHDNSSQIRFFSKLLKVKCI